MQVIMMMRVVVGVEGLQDQARTRLLIAASSAQRSSLVIVIIIIIIVIIIATILRTKVSKGHLLRSLSPLTLMKSDDDNNVCNS